ncbi:xanthine dehydrogenase family protein molybdopterin-binding subunit [Chachezhania antarctica]|uniref:xanthine dehydrogenase family protein molybdopterin-binding subunit n=1 Tax=Chachezhania antarctica TaxID=2340860 RepID=UPI001969789F|nr:molybdopterin cofactor-binding domain-containing protein [Chachezhania antarctica]
MNRRQVLKASVAGGITIALSPLPALSAFTASLQPEEKGWRKDGDRNVRYRVDGFAKVTGRKIYARDYRAADMDSWPDETSHAAIVFAQEAAKIYTGLDLSALGEDLVPDIVITAKDLHAADIAATGFFATDLLCAEGQTPAYLGQPTAILIWHDFDRFTSARLRMQSAGSIASFGATGTPAQSGPYGANRFTRVAGSNPEGPDVYSPVKDGWVGPARYQKGEAPVWSPAKPDGQGPGRATAYGEAMRKALADGTAGQVFGITFETQSVDQVFMEPESGLAWYDASKKTLNAVLGVQSPQAILEGIAGMVAKADTAHEVRHIEGHFGYLGGGFGGKDHTIVPLYVALAALFAGGRPVRLALNRFEQFQFGLKRHAITADMQIGVEPQTGMFTTFTADLDCNGGGRANFSASVADVAATGAPSIYYFPKSDVTTVAKSSRGVCAGSMRGYGTLQTMTATECLVDDIARGLKIDPFALRRRNMLQTGALNMTGNPASGMIRTKEVLDRLEQASLWQNRDRDKTVFEWANSGYTYAVGMACVMKDFGTGADGVLSSVSLTTDGVIEITGNVIEMGTGITTALAARAARRLGQLATTVRTDEPAHWDPLQLVSSGNPWGISQADQDEASKNPRWVPQISSPASASIGAHVNAAAVDQAAEVIRRFGLWPAAQAIWSEGQLGGQQAGEFVTYADLRWSDGALTGAGMEPIPLPRLAARAHEMGLVTGAMLHAFNRWSWATAEFDIDGTRWRGPVDALAVQKGSADWQLLDRTSVAFPSAAMERVGVNYYSACGAVVALAVGRNDGSVQVLGVHQVLECGSQLVPELVSGNSEGGIAMGIGYALHEDLPLYEDGPGNGTWNLNRYHVPKAADVPVWNMTLEVLDPLSETDPPKGMGEVVMIPVVPAILNGLREATGHRFTKLPVTQDDIRKAL